MLALAAAAHALAAFMFRSINRRTPSRFIDWYSLALFLVAVGLAGLLALNTIGSLLGWAARIAQFTGCAYLLTAVLSSRGFGAWRISLGRRCARRKASPQPRGPVSRRDPRIANYPTCSPPSGRDLFAPRRPPLTACRCSSGHPDFRERVRSESTTLLGGKSRPRGDGSGSGSTVPSGRRGHRALVVPAKRPIQVVARDVTEREACRRRAKLQRGVRRPPGDVR